MDFGAINGVSGRNPQVASYQPMPTRPESELTTVTTHCDEDHQHDRSCPHTVTTRPAPKPGEAGALLDVYA